MRKIILFLICLKFQISYAQKIPKIKLKNYRVAYLSDTLRETSGICFLENRLLTFNDGGNPNCVYDIDPQRGKILQTIKLPFPNIDWEAIAIDGDQVFIGDFGNNIGNRDNLTVYEINLKDTAVAKLAFKYKNQDQFIQQTLHHNFDCEAMIFLDKKLHLFSKEWKSKNTSHYIIDPNDLQNNHAVEAEEKIKTKFLTTDAAYYNNKLYLVGYTKTGRCFLQIFEKDNKTGMFFKQSIAQFKLGSVLSIGQVEGVAVNEKGIFITAEGFKKFIFCLKPSLYFIPFKELSNFAP